MTRGRHGLRGIWTACLALVMIVAVSIGFAAVTVLIVALDSGGSVDPVNAAVFGWVLFLISQGVKVTTFGVLLGVPPLLLTLFDILCITALVRKRSPQLRAYVFGVVTWVAVTLLISFYSGFILSDSLLWSGAKAALVFSAGYLAGSYKKLASDFTARWGETLRPSLRIVTREAMRVVRWLCITFAVISIVVVLLWILINREAMGKVFDMTHMPIGSRIITTILSLFWLPNLCLWALSWLFGSGFSIGGLGSFTLWSGSAHDLPPVPIFGIFPQAVSADSLRFAFLLIPIVLGFVVGIIELVSKNGYNFFDLSDSDIANNAVLKRMRLPRFMEQHAKKTSKKTARSISSIPGALPSATDDDSAESLSETSGDTNAAAQVGTPVAALPVPDQGSESSSVSLLHLLITKGAYPIASFCVSSVIVVFVSAVCFAASNGALGTGNLKTVGVSVAASTQAVARPVFSGLLIAWVLLLVVLCARQILSNHKRTEMPSTSLKEDDLVPLDEIKMSENSRMVASSASPSSPQEPGSRDS